MAVGDPIAAGPIAVASSDYVPMYPPAAGAWSIEAVMHSVPVILLWTTATGSTGMVCSALLPAPNTDAMPPFRVTTGAFLMAYASASGFVAPSGWVEK